MPLMDNCLITLKMIWSEDNRGKDNWKFNCSYLQDKAFVDVMNKHIGDFVTECEEMSNLNLKWDLFKSSVKKLCREYGIRKKERRFKNGK